MVPPNLDSSELRQEYTADANKVILQKMSLISDQVYGPDHEQYNQDAVGDLDSTSASPKFFKWDRWGSFQFKTLNFDEEHIPVGDSPRYCLGLQYKDKSLEKFNQPYKQIKGFDQCYGAVGGRGFWDKNWPQIGVNFRIWMQEAVKVGEGCEGDNQMPFKSYCYSYLVASKVCLLLKFQRDND